MPRLTIVTRAAEISVEVAHIVAFIGDGTISFPREIQLHPTSQDLGKIHDAILAVSDTLAPELAPDDDAVRVAIAEAYVDGEGRATTEYLKHHLAKAGLRIVRAT